MSDSGIFYDLPVHEHRACPRVSPSSLRHLAQSPAALRHALAHPMVPTLPMLLGTLVHGLVLEGRVPAGMTLRPPGTDLRTTAGKHWRGSLPLGTEIVSEDTMTQAEAIAAAVRAHPVVAELLATGRTEVSLRWTDTATGVDLKGRADLVVQAVRKILDLKVTGNDNVTREEAARMIRGPKKDLSRGYVPQIAAYCDGWYTLTGETMRGGFIVAGREPPYPVEVYGITEATQETGMIVVERLLAQWAEAVASGVYPANATTWNKDLDLLRWDGGAE